jgi:hypothetical protein
VKHLKRDLVMASLFAESESFALASRDNTRKVKIHNQAKVPTWAQNRYANARHANQERREHNEKLDRVARISPANLTGAAPDEQHSPQTVP